MSAGISSPISFGEYLKLARKSKGMTQSHAGDLIFMSNSNVASIERGDMILRLNSAIQIARRLEFSEKSAIECCLQDQFNVIHVNYRVTFESKTSLKARKDTPSFGQYLVEFRSRSNLSAGQCCRKLSISRPKLKQIENERYKRALLIQSAVYIANTLGFSEKAAIECCIQDQLRDIEIEYFISIEKIDRKGT